MNTAPSQNDSVSATPPEPSTPSDSSLVIRNLRLLDLHCLADWPQISLDTFTRAANNPRDKDRISTGEWVLYRLFEIWDRRLTATTLASFFPPLVPLQSVNLRAALYRALSDLKRDGILGRETVLRKTTLDECRGERFIELLLAFSTAVLRKRTLEQHAALTAIDDIWLGAVPAAFQRNLGLMRPLTIAYRTSIQTHLRKKVETGVGFRSLKEKLQFKEALLRERKNAARQALEDLQHTSKALDIDILETQTLVQDEFPEGDPWLDLMLNVNSDNGRDDYLEAGFDAIWTASENGVPPETKPVKLDLLSDLKSRISQQNTRLQEWRAFQTQLSSRMQHLSQTPRKTPKSSAFTSPPKSTARSPRKSPYKTTPSSRVEMGRPLQPLAMESAERLAEITQPPSPSKALPRPVSTPLYAGMRARSISPRKPPNAAMASPTREFALPRPRANLLDSEGTMSISPPTQTAVPEDALSKVMDKMSLTERAQTTLEHSLGGTGSEQASQPDIKPPFTIAQDSANTTNMTDTLAERARKSMAYAQRTNSSSQTPQPTPATPTPSHVLPPPPALPSTPQAPMDMVEDDDCASIFKSRPKLKTSPVGSLVSSPVPWKIQ